MNKNQITLLFVLLVFLEGCTDYTPRPRGYFRIELKKKEWRKMKEDASKEGMILDKKYQDLNSQIDVLNMDYKDRRDSIANSYIPSYEWNKIKSHLKQIREEANKTNKK